jgi:hypothetical protein
MAPNKFSEERTVLGFGRGQNCNASPGPCPVQTGDPRPLIIHFVDEASELLDLFVSAFHYPIMRSTVIPRHFIIMPALLSSMVLPAFSQETPLGEFDGHTDVGPPKLSGSASYDAVQQEYILTGAGTNMWVGRDEFQFVWKKLQGGFLLRTRAEFVGKGAVDHRKIGWMVRPTLEADAPYADCARHGVDLASLQFRRSRGAITEQIVLPITNPDVLQFERKGTTFIFSAAHYGEPFVSGQLTNFDLGDEVYVGLFICSHTNDVMEKAIFRDVRIIKPVRENFVPYKDFI